MVKVKSFDEVELLDGSGSFPVVIIERPVVARGSDGSTRITNRDNVREPMFRYQMELEEVFPAHEEQIPSIRIEQYLLETPLKCENPETGEIITVQTDIRSFRPMEACHRYLQYDPLSGTCRAVLGGAATNGKPDFYRFIPKQE